MILRAAGSNPAAVTAYGAYQSGTRLRCPVLLVRHGNTAPVVTLRELNTTQEFTVKLPPQAIGNRGHLRFDREELEIV